MTLRLLATLLRRELRGSARRAALFVLSLAIGVAAVVAVAGLADGVDRAIRLESRPLLAADVAVNGRRPLPDSVAALGERFGAERAEIRTFGTMAAAPPSDDGAPGRSLLVDLKAVDGPYPFYGDLTLDPPQPLADLLGDDGVVVDPALSERLGLALGDALVLGGVPFTLRGHVLAEPDRLDGAFATGPRVFVSAAGLARTPLDDTTGRIRYRTLFRAPDQAPALVAALEADPEVAAWAQVETWSDAQPTFRRGVGWVEQFLGLVALLSLLVGGAGVAQVLRAWLAQRLDDLATLRCLGLTPADVRLLALAQTLALALLASAVGSAVGLVAVTLAPLALDGILPAQAFTPWQPGAVLRGTALGTGVALVFAWLPLRDASRVPPMRALRRDVEPAADPWWRRAGIAAVLLAAMGVVAVVQAGSVTLGLTFAAVVAGVVVGLAAVSGGVATALGRLGRQRSTWWLRHGLSALERPGSQAFSTLVALSLGVVVVLGTLRVQGALLGQLGSGFPPDAPSLFLIDVQADQWPDAERLLADADADHVTSTHMVMGRLAAINGRPTSELVADLDASERWAFTREQRLAVRDAPASHNTVVAGAFASDPSRAEVSLEERYAERLGVGLGDTVTFDVQGIPIELAVTSIRHVAWETFQMNFFLVVEPGVLDRAPGWRLVSAQLPAAAEPALQDALAATLPNVTLLSIRDVRETVAGVLANLGLAVQALGGFTALAGAVVLAIAVSASAARRAGQVALLKTLGTTRAGVAAVLGVEYALLGAVAGTVGVVGAEVLAGVIVTQFLRLDWAPAPVLALATVGVTVLGVTVAGLAGNRRAMSAPPADVFRGV